MHNYSLEISKNFSNALGHAVHLHRIQSMLALFEENRNLKYVAWMDADILLMNLGVRMETFFLAAANDAHIIVTPDCGKRIVEANI